MVIIIIIIIIMYGFFFSMCWRVGTGKGGKDNLVLSPSTSHSQYCALAGKPTDKGVIGS